MHRLTLTVIAAGALAGAGAFTFVPRTNAQPAPPGPPTPAMPMMSAPMSTMPRGPMHGPMGRPPAGPWMQGAEMHDAMVARLRTWGLFHRPADLGLSPGDVQTIAEAILLRNGQHDWKVGDVTPNADHTVSFAFTTTHGDVIARFSMDTSTGRISRTN